MSILSKLHIYKGSQELIASEIFASAICTVTCDDVITLAYVDRDADVTAMFVLDPGTHRVRCRDNVDKVMVSCNPEVGWSVRVPSRFDVVSSDRVSASLVRPRTQREEMQDYVNELIARATGGQTAQMLRNGQAEIDTADEDYDDDEDDHDSPLSVHQMSLIMQMLERDIQRQQADAPVPPAPEPPPAEPAAE